MSPRRIRRKLFMLAALFAAILLISAADRHGAPQEAGIAEGVTAPAH